nr:hypothetical protein [uncultured Undibacterium sp.]
MDAVSTPNLESIARCLTPSSLLGITSSNATHQASVSALTTGRGEFTVSYLVDGKSASKTVPASVVQLLRFDAPEMIELGLIDADGRNKPPAKVPFVSVPAASGDLLRFKGFDPKFLSLATGASELTLQGVRPGITSLQAETLCGTAVGPRIGVKVVTCDKDSRETLERRKRGVKERNDTISRRVQELLNDPEFVRVEREIKDDVINLAFKTGSTIVGALSMAQGGQIKAAEGRLSQLSPQQLKWLTAIKPEQASIKAIKDVVGLYTLTSSLMNGFDGAMQAGIGQGDNSESYKAAIKGLISGTVKLIKNERLGLAKTFIEAAMAAQKMGRNVGTLAGVADQLAELDGQHESVRNEWERIAKLIKRCDATIPEGDSDLELIEPISGGKAGNNELDSRKRRNKSTQTKPVKATPNEDENVVQKPAGTQDPIKVPLEKPTSFGGVSLCVATSQKPSDIAKELHRIKSVYETYALKMKRASESVSGAYQRVLEELVVRAEEGSESLRTHLPALKVAHDEAFLAIANEGDTSLKHLMETQQCESKLAKTPIDLKRIKWDFLP